jgi:hypothetical protein
LLLIISTSDDVYISVINHILKLNSVDYVHTDGLLLKTRS